MNTQFLCSIPMAGLSTWNAGPQRIKGYTASEIIGQHFSIFYPKDARESGWPEHELQVAAEKGSFVDTGWRLRKDGTTFWANVTITALRDDTGRLFGYAKLTRDHDGDQAGRGHRACQSAARGDVGCRAECAYGRAARNSTQRRIPGDAFARTAHALERNSGLDSGVTQRRGAQRDPIEQKRAIEVIDRNARAQIQLIDDLLDLSRIMTGKIRLDLHQISFASVVEAAVDSAMPVGSSQGHPTEGDLGRESRHRQRRQCPAAASRVEPADQRDQVHAEGRPSTSTAPTREFAPRTERQRHRHWHSSQFSSARLRPILAKRQLDNEGLRWSRVGPGDLQATRGIARRFDKGRKSG